jgi:hypothetical protein
VFLLDLQACTPFKAHQEPWQATFHVLSVGALAALHARKRCRV